MRPTRRRNRPRRSRPAAARPPAGGEAAAGGGECCKPGDTTPTLDLIKATPKGGLHNPYADKVTDAAFAEEGHKAYLSAGCNGCHGGGGGGGMCPPLTNDTWVYGPDDDTLFRLIALGTDELKDAGLSPRQERGRGRPDAALRRDPQDQRSAVEDHHLHPLGESELGGQATAAIALAFGGLFAAGFSDKPPSPRGFGGLSFGVAERLPRPGRAIAKLLYSLGKIGFRGFASAC